MIKSDDEWVKEIFDTIEEVSTDVIRTDVEDFFHIIPGENDEPFKGYLSEEEMERVKALAARFTITRPYDNVLKIEFL